ncbi:hypothetical protein GCM10010885_18290 [Alicyclobacillus cellulosilyticus]|uniref:Tfp pilus assembly PilM family ATPase n=1 Tax=Alicyclobacillus cellulosilyticus TaxID=1003997 RepID=A0A917NLF1_9BACL|nr:hypothetical protein GCM10010885_18290 [Alicyclobacillus cellulosilyticus]
MSSEIQVFLHGLRKTVKRNHWRGRRVAIGIPGESVLVRRFRLPNMPHRGLRIAVQHEVEHRLSLPIADPLYDFSVIQNGLNEQEVEIVLVAASRSVVMPWVELATACGLHPVAVEPSILAVARAVEWNETVDAMSYPAAADPGATHVHALVHLMEDGLDFALLLGKDMVFLRHVSVAQDHNLAPVGSSMEELSLLWPSQPFVTNVAGSGREMEQSSAQLEAGFASAWVEQVVDEVERSLTFAARHALASNQEVSRVTVLDQTGRLPEVIAALRERLTVDVAPAVVDVQWQEGDTRRSVARFQNESFREAPDWLVRHRLAPLIGLVMGVKR